MRTRWGLTLWLFHLLGAGLGDSIEPRELQMAGGEGASATLSCRYRTDYTGGVYLYWYRQHPNRAPQYLLWRQARSFSQLSNTAEFARGRFASQADDNSTALTITSLELEDAAVYFCALQRAQ